jgi:hypothetical protein
MCWKKIWDWINGTVPPVEPPIPPLTTMKKIAILAAINNYPGTQNDLNGCLNDQANVVSKLPDFEKRLFKDSQATIDNFSMAVLKAADETETGDNVVIHYSGHGTYLADMNGDEVDGKDEALYLYDGPLVDDDFGALLDHFKPGVKVYVFLDSCFSESATRAFNLLPGPSKGKFMRYEDFKIAKKVPHNKLLKTSIKWVVFSGCSEHQTSADAYINGMYEGAATHFLWGCIDRKYTAREWFNEMRKSLPSAEYEQIPTLEGPEDIINQLIFT